MARPPQHNARAPIEYIRKGDPAWSDAYNDELEAVDDASEHPMVKYYMGETRYDLDAPGTVTAYDEDDEEQVATKTPRQYLREDAKPVIFRLKRLRIGEVSRFRDQGARTGAAMAYSLAIKEIDNAPSGVKCDRREGRRTISDRQLEEHAEAFGMQTIWEVGEAALRASEAPSYAEKKP
jgi:hypothetical protein